MESIELQAQTRVINGAVFNNGRSNPNSERDLGIRWQSHEVATKLFSQAEEETLLGSVDKSLPDFDKCNTTRISCTGGLSIAICASLGCMISSGVMLHNLNGWIFQETSLSVAAAEALLFVINILVALLTDAMGYIHGTSLRWALYREGRLNFNTNIRLFTSARKNAPNRWPANVICITSLILCYAATSQLLVPGTVRQWHEPTPWEYTYDDFFTAEICLNGIALFALGLGLLGQVAICAWAMLSSNSKIATWSSNPLNNTLALQHHHLQHHHLQRLPGRCMMSVHQAEQPTQPIKPSPKQRSVAKGNSSVVRILIVLWVIVLVALVWAIIIVLVSRHSVLLYEGHWYLTDSWYITEDEERGVVTNGVPLYMNPYNNNENIEVFYPWSTQAVLGLLFTFAVQGTQTMGLHCVELMVNMSRDEDEWRRAQLTRKGSRLSTNGFKAAISSWQNGVLFISKAALHWLLGQSLATSVTMDPDPGGLGQRYEFQMIYMRIFVFAIVAFALAVFATYLAYRRPSGCQPASWGHFQTLVDLVDDWKVSANGLLWWGDKGVETDGVRHAGTSWKRGNLGDIRIEALYSGIALEHIELGCASNTELVNV